MTEPVADWSQQSEELISTKISVVWVSHGSRLLRCHPSQLRNCSERELALASLKGLVPATLPTTVSEMTRGLRPGEFLDLSGDLPSEAELRGTEVDLPEEPPVSTDVSPSLGRPRAGEEDAAEPESVLPDEAPASEVVAEPRPARTFLDSPTWFPVRRLSKKTPRADPWAGRPSRAASSSAPDPAREGNKGNGEK